MNYLVALSYDRNRIEFTDDTTLNQIYADLISEVYHRQYDGGRVSVCVGELKETEFERVLEEIALAIWHGDGRTASISSIQEKCKASGIQQYLDSFQEGAKAGVTRLLTAFYFRQSENHKDGDPTFEFTHKSFGEYLTALRILRVLRQIQTQIERRKTNPDDGWSEKEALERWTEFCSPIAIDADLIRFINNEFRKMHHENLIKFQIIVCGLLTYTINLGLPFSPIYANKGFKQHLRLARNAEEALIAVHFSIAKITKQVSRLELKSDTTFCQWISRVKGQRQWFVDNRLALMSLGFLDLSDYFLSLQDFFNANFESSRLIFTQFAGAYLEGVNFEGAILKRAFLPRAFLSRANLRGANLRGANLERADLEKANLQMANLKGANLQGANLKSANLQGASLKGANLKGANLQKTNFQGANLEEANLLGANLKSANLLGTNLKRTKKSDTHKPKTNNTPTASEPSAACPD